MITRTAYAQLIMTTADQASESLTEALAKAQIPSANHEFIRQITTAVGIAEYHSVVTATKTYIKAVRRDGNRDLHISYGYTNGFSEDELDRIAAGATRGASTRKGTWYVEHPSHQGACHFGALSRQTPGGCVLHLRHAVVVDRSLLELRLNQGVIDIVRP